ncbi:MAG: GNAT family N-acetyltransferase [Oscillospiraceae bacterium]|nr:GNAT family N-acetyltransferase [Oscillospiraceae bacterium]
MLIIAKSMKDLSFSALMEIYIEGNMENGQDNYPEEPEYRQIMLAEQDFYNYLSQVFFRTDGAVYLIWEERGKYVSALRLEPYQDGLLLEALETAPDQRQKGYAKTLILAALGEFDGKKIYSHVSKRNTPSIRTHEVCGFEKILDHAVYADGSVLRSSVTYCHG